MKPLNPSPLSRGKPRWMARYMRLWRAYLIGLGCWLAGSLLITPKLPDPWALAYSVAMLLYTFGGQVYIALWPRSFGVKCLGLNRMLERRERVPCPNCLYLMCSPKDAARMHVCAECGCAISGHEAIRAWGRVRGMRVPGWWRKVNES